MWASSAAGGGAVLSIQRGQSAKQHLIRQMGQRVQLHRIPRGGRVSRGLTQHSYHEGFRRSGMPAGLMDAGDTGNAPGPSRIRPSARTLRSPAQDSRGTGDPPTTAPRELVKRIRQPAGAGSRPAFEAPDMGGLVTRPRSIPHVGPLAASDPLGFATAPPVLLAGATPGTDSGRSNSPVKVLRGAAENPLES
jgi:hypothetical protein